eukprot:7099653-Pyramimonas_sp.AAC.1
MNRARALNHVCGNASPSRGPGLISKRPAHPAGISGHYPSLRVSGLAGSARGTAGGRLLLFAPRIHSLPRHGLIHAPVHCEAL